METLEHYLEAALSTRDTFEQRFPHPFLVVAIPKASFTAQALVFKTALNDSGQLREVWRKIVALRFRGKHFEVRQNCLVFRICKHAEAPEGAPIVVGRNPECDISLPDQSISKVHAHFARDNDRFTLADAGSLNGTQLNGRRLPPRQRAPVAAGDRVDFGPFETLVMSPLQFYGRLKSSIVEMEVPR